MKSAARSRSSRAAPRATISIRLSQEQRLQLRKACRLRQISQSGYLTRLAVEGTRHDLVQYAVRAYREGRASLSELAGETGLDVPTILDAVAVDSASTGDAVQAFLKDARDLARSLKDQELYELAKAAVKSLEKVPAAL